jgi:hypothetical protein
MDSDGDEVTPPIIVRFAILSSAEKLRETQLLVEDQLAIIEFIFFSAPPAAKRQTKRRGGGTPEPNKQT